MRRTLLGWLPRTCTVSACWMPGAAPGHWRWKPPGGARMSWQLIFRRPWSRLAQERLPHDLSGGSIDFHVGDMLDPAVGRFDYVVAMDSLIHYRPHDTVRVLDGLAERTERSVLFTFAPRTPALSVMHAVGRLFPRGDRAPAIEPVRPQTITSCRR